MIGWSTIAPTIKAIFSEIAINRRADGTDVSGSAPFTAEWVDGRKPWADGKRFTITDPRGFALGLTVTSVTAIGEDETRREMVDGQLIESQTGQRKFTLQVQALAIAGGANSDWAIAITERARTRLNSDRIIDRLLAVDVSIIGCGPSVYLSHRDGTRMLTSATMDVVFGCTANEDDPVAAGWIQYAVLSGHVQDTSGTELPPPTNWVDQEIPTIP